MLTKITRLAVKFSAHLTRHADIDALESYPGEDSSNQEKLEVAMKAVSSDLTSIMNTYYMYQSQHEQAKKQMNHQIHLLKFAKKVQQLIDELIAGGSNIDSDTLKEQITQIEEESLILGKELNTKISLAELESLRLLKAFIADEVAKTQSKLPTPDWAAISRRRQEEDLVYPDDETTDILTEDDFINDNDSETRRIDPASLSKTLRSPGTADNTKTVAV